MASKRKQPDGGEGQGSRKKGSQKDAGDYEELYEELEEEEEEADVVEDRDAPAGSFSGRDFSKLVLKPDHANRPLWVCEDGHIFLETFSPLYKQAQDFLVAISEPMCRPEFIHEYALTPHSLYAAVSVGLATSTITTVLERLSKAVLPQEIHDFISSSTLNYGKVKLVLQKNRFFVESPFPKVLETLLKDDVIAKARINQEQFTVSTAPKEAVGAEKELLEETGGAAGILEAATEEKEIHSFEIDPNMVEHVKQKCLPNNLNYPMLEEYDFRNDTVNKDITSLELKPLINVRPYQEKSLSKMFGNGRARSGIIVLPCGAGKSLVGVSAAARIRKSCLCLCTNSVSVDQWTQQFKQWSTIRDHEVARFTSETKEMFKGLAGVVVTTYNMVAFGGQRSAESQKIIEQIRAREWGLLLMDEVHVVPAHMFRKVISITKSHCKLGLTATLVREDERISDLNFLIGPKLYEANWLDLVRGGFIANVQCVEVWCPMTKEFYAEYLQRKNASKKQALYVMNPNKFRACEYLMRTHEARGDKVIIFSDNIFAINEYSRALMRPAIYGATSHHERTLVIQAFKHQSHVNTILLSKVGDNSIDIPEANVIIQISSHAGSRRQEAQRLGRILRSKGTPASSEPNAFFYSLVSTDTQEMYYSTKRQQFLVDQGYAFKVVTQVPPADSGADLMLSTKQEQLDLLAKVMAAGEDVVGLEQLAEDVDDVDAARRQGAGGAARRTVGSMKQMSGAQGMVYMEYSTQGGAPAGAKTMPRRKPLDPNRPRHKLFKQRFR